MNSRLKHVEALPPRLSMNEYVQWISENVRHTRSGPAQRQKEIEERVAKPFCIPPPEDSSKPATK